MRSFLILVTCAVVVLLYFSQEVEGDTLKLVQVFFRHGARTPELKDAYPNDPYKIDTFLPMGWGQLTNDGKQQAYKLGKVLRQRYDSFLGNIYTPHVVHAQSTDFDRTKMSALLALAGLFKPDPSQIWDEELHWLPIPVSYEKHESDFMLRRPNIYCPTYLGELEKVSQSEMVATYLKKNKKVIEYIAENAGKPMNKLTDLFGIFQTLTAERWMNLTLPEWTKSVFPDEITELAAKQCEIENSNPTLKRLNGGRSLKKVIETMVAKSTLTLYPHERKIYLYSGHENNVINILSALNVYKTHFPNYSSAVMIELHQLEDEEEYAVKVLYLKSVDAEPEEQQLEGCDVLCPLTKFIEISRPFIPVNYTAECGSQVDLH